MAVLTDHEKRAIGLARQADHSAGVLKREVVV
jgi:hypothetical protein